MIMEFTTAELQTHDDHVRRKLLAEMIKTLDSYGEGLQRQALAQGVNSNVNVLRGSLEATLFITSVMQRMYD